MITNKLALDIVGIFNRDITSLLSINQISKKLNKAYPHINSTVNELIRERVLCKAEIGRSYLCSIDLASDKAIALLSLNDARRKETFLSKVADRAKILQEIRRIRSEFGVRTILINKGKMIFVLDHVYDGDAIKNRYQAIKQFRLAFTTKEEFCNMLIEELDILRERIILYSPESFYELVECVRDRLLSRTVRGAQ